MIGRVLVTGGNGRLGRHVLAVLGGRGVAGVRRHVDAAPSLIIDGDGHVDPAQLVGFDAVINCAGRVTGTPAELAQTNVDYPMAVAQGARAAGVARFVQVSSFSVYGRIERIGPDSALRPESDYGRSKLAAEQALAAVADSLFDVASVRLPFMFSAAEPALLRPLVATMLRLRVLPTLYGAPSRRSMLTYAGAADALVRLATQPARPPEVTNAADPEPLELTAVAAAIRSRLERRIAIIPLPTALGRWVHPLAPSIVDRLFRSSVLDASANFLAGGTPYPIAADIDAYLRRLAS